MSSPPPRQPNSAPHNTGSTAQRAGTMLNRFARRDPQLYPLAAVMVAILGVGGYFLMSKSQHPSSSKAGETRTKGPWEGEGGTGKFKYTTKSGEVKEHPEAFSNGEQKPVNPIKPKT